MIRNPFDGSHEHLTSSPRKGVPKGRIDKLESCPDRLKWAQRQGQS
jgi:hypothetical protein